MLWACRKPGTGYGAAPIVALRIHDHAWAVRRVVLLKSLVCSRFFGVLVLYVWSPRGVKPL